MTRYFLQEDNSRGRANGNIQRNSIEIAKIRRGQEETEEEEGVCKANQTGITIVFIKILMQIRL